MAGRHTDRTLEVPVPAGSTQPDRKHAVLTVLSTTKAGTLIALEDRDITLGRSDDATLTIEDDSLSRRHARITCRGGKHLIEDLASTNGTFVDGARVEQPVELHDGCRIQLGRSTLIRFTLQDDQEYRATQRMYEASVRDALTGVYNRHYFEERLQSEFSYAHRHRVPLSVLFMDIDHFKDVNDEHGHAAGDQVLAAVAAKLAATVRLEDVVSRYGGEEFVILLRGIDREGASVLAERLRSFVESTPVQCEATAVTVTVSVGVASFSSDQSLQDAHTLVAVADGALYRAKEQGRNRVCIA